MKPTGMKRAFNIVDTSFAHDVGAVAGKAPHLLAWDRSGTRPELPTFYTHEKIFTAPGGPGCYGLLFESKAIVPRIYELAPQAVERFELVFTHDQALLDRFPDRCLPIPGGGIWIGGPQGEGEIRLYPKSKLVSMVSSTKAMCPLHKLRYDIATALKPVAGIDVFIGGGGRGTPGWVPIVATLADYMYSIVMENYVDDRYFTEKILNCFATGTVPIYLGARRIGDVFDAGGIITFSNWDELKAILPTLSPDDYRRRAGAIIENFRRCHGYETIEDYIVTHYGDRLPAFPAGSAS